MSSIDKTMKRSQNHRQNNAEARYSNRRNNKAGAKTTDKTMETSNKDQCQNTEHIPNCIAFTDLSTVLAWFYYCFANVLGIF